MGSASRRRPRLLRGARRRRCRYRWARSQGARLPMAAFSARRRPVIDLMKTRARSFIYSTGLPPASVAAALAALDVIAREPAIDRAAARRRRARFTSRPACPRRKARSCRSMLGDAASALEALALLEAKAFSSPRSVRRPCPTARRGSGSLSPRTIPMPRSSDWPMLMRTRIAR